VTVLERASYDRSIQMLTIHVWECFALAWLNHVRQDSGHSIKVITFLDSDPYFGSCTMRFYELEFGFYGSIDILKHKKKQC
jgi:hypothetical protein